MRWYVPQRQILLDIAASISESVGSGVAISRAAADMTWPDWQYPHCTTSRSSHARCSARPCGVAPIPSMVVTAPLPTLLMGVTQDRRGVPSMITVQAPHSATPQPNLVPVLPRTSRNTHSSGVSPSTSTLCADPLTLTVKAIVHLKRDLQWAGEAQLFEPLPVFDNADNARLVSYLSNALL
jgi:hypothetical protein